MVIVLCTSSYDALYLRFNEGYLERFSSYSADKILSQKLLFSLFKIYKQELWSLHFVCHMMFNSLRYLECFFSLYTEAKETQQSHKSS